MLSPADQDRIAAAVAKAEAQTTGEVFCTVTEEVSAYREIPLAYAAAAALLLPPLALLAGLPLRWPNLGGEWTAAHGVSADAAVGGALAVYASLQAVVFALVGGVTAITPVRRALTPGAMKSARVRRLARQLFLATGMAGDPERTGVLIFASFGDRRVELVADEIIHQAAEPGAWDAATAALTAALRRGAPAEGFEEAITVCGAALARAFPAAGEDVNRMPDRPVQL